MTTPTFTKPKRHVERVFLHCSASEMNMSGKAMVDEIRRWHKARGFTDIGYQFLIDKAGLVMTGRSLETRPAAQKGHNTDTIAIMVHGLELDLFPDVALQACKSLCAEINEAYEGRVSFHGHCEVSAKACPVFDYAALLGLDRFGRMP